MPEQTIPQPQPRQPAGWYDDGSGRLRWWDGFAWQMYAPQQPVNPHYAQQPLSFPQQSYGPPIRQANDMGVSYVRTQTGHSLTGWLIASLVLVFPVIGLIYYSVSPNHYWHA